MLESNYVYLFYVLYLLVAVMFSVMSNWLFLKFSRNLGIRDSRDISEVRWSASSKPALGGISFFILFLLSIALIGYLPFEDATIYNKQLIGILAACSLGFIIGLADDAYNTNPLVKFIGQMTCAFILIVTDLYIQLTGIPAVDFVFTTIWVIGLMNSINMLDNMDGITGTVSCSVLIGAIILLFITGQFNSIYILLLVGVLGSLIGFLFFNWNPSKIYMGDTGTQFLGVFLAAVSILFFWNFRDANGPAFQFRQFILPMLIFIIPLIDTTTVTIRRLMRGQSPFIGGKDHITHHLAYLGLSDRMVGIVLFVISLTSIPIAVLICAKGSDYISAATWFSFIYFAVAFIIFQLLYNRAKQKLAKKVIES